MKANTLFFDYMRVVCRWAQRRCNGKHDVLEPFSKQTFQLCQPRTQVIDLELRLQRADELRKQDMSDSSPHSIS